MSSNFVAGAASLLLTRVPCWFRLKDGGRFCDTGDCATNLVMLPRTLTRRVEWRQTSLMFTGGGTGGASGIALLGAEALGGSVVMLVTRVPLR